MVCFRRTQQCGNSQQGKMRQSPVSSFQKNLVVWKLISLTTFPIIPSQFQKNLVVWKLYIALPALGDFFPVSEELSSVETTKSTHLPSTSISPFQKNLVVWKLRSRGGQCTSIECFRRTQQCGNEDWIKNLKMEEKQFQKNLVVWKLLFVQILLYFKYEFQKNLVVWKHESRSRASSQDMSFRRTQQCGNC